jgi:hypothetical protein
LTIDTYPNELDDVFLMVYFRLKESLFWTMSYKGGFCNLRAFLGWRLFS